MTRRLFVCHASAEIESTSEVVDALENALDFPEGSLLTSSLPGYASDANDEFALRDTLGGANMVLALVSETSLRDPAFCFQLGAAWALGLRSVLCAFDELEASRLPPVLRDTPLLHVHDPAEWTELIGDLALRLGLVPRPAASVAPQLAPSSTSPSSRPLPMPAATAPAASVAVSAPTAAGKPSGLQALATEARAATSAFSVPAVELSPSVTQPGFRTPASKPLASFPDEDPGSDEPTAPSVPAPAVPPLAAAVPEPAQPEQDIHDTVERAFAEISDELRGEPGPAPRHTYIDELRHIAEPDEPQDHADHADHEEHEEHADDELATSPRHSYISELQSIADEAAEELAEVAPAAPEPLPAAAALPDFVTVSGSEPPLTSDIFARLPSCEMALEAGRALSDCVFNREEISDFRSELSGPLGRFYESLGGLWDELSRDQDIDFWADAVEGRLSALPEEARKIEDWYKLGYELAILHNLAGQLVLDGTDAAAEQQWRGALERFLMRAERAEIGYEDLGRVLGLLENLAGPSSERDLANIGRSLSELRRYAAGADGIHTAA